MGSIHAAVKAKLVGEVSPAGAFAAPGPVTTFGKSYTLACSVNANDGEALKVRTMVKNTTGHIIKKGTPIALRFVYSWKPGVRPNGPTTMPIST